MVHFTPEEKEIIKKVLMSTPVQGNIQTLPTLIEKIVVILKKLEHENEAPPNPDPLGLDVSDIGDSPQ